MAYKNIQKKRDYQNAWVKRNRKKHNCWVAAGKEKVKQWLKEYKKDQHCSICKESHPSCLDFHHKDDNEKLINISTTASQGWSIKRLQKEIEKCIVLCANCHRKHHWKE